MMHGLPGTCLIIMWNDLDRDGWWERVRMCMHDPENRTVRLLYPTGEITTWAGIDYGSFIDLYELGIITRVGGESGSDG